MPLLTVCVPCPILACSCFGGRPFRPSQCRPRWGSSSLSSPSTSPSTSRERAWAAAAAAAAARTMARGRRRQVGRRRRVIQTRSHLTAFGTRHRAPCPWPTLACRLTVSLIASLHSSLDVARTPWRGGVEAWSDRRAREPACQRASAALEHQHQHQHPPSTRPAPAPATAWASSDQYAD
jgi:hypothetical protein